MRSATSNDGECLLATNRSDGLIVNWLNRGGGHNLWETYVLPVDFSIEYVCILI